MRFGRANARDRDTRCTVSKPTVTYNDDGVEVITTNTSLEFWGKIVDMKDIGGLSAYKTLDARTIAIEVDARTVASVTILDTLTTDQGPQEYEVVDKYDSEWRFTAMIIAKYKN